MSSYKYIILTIADHYIKHNLAIQLVVWAEKWAGR